MFSQDYNMRSMFQTDHHRVRSVSNRHQELMLRGKGSGEPGVMKAMNELRGEVAFE